MTTQLKVRVTRKAQIKLKVLPRFPSSVTVESPVTLARTGGNYDFGLDVTALRASLDPVYENASNLSGGTVPAARIAATGKPFFILATGQSNLNHTPALSWTPNPNAKRWNNTLNTDGNVGTAFAALSGTTINIADKFASDIADQNLTRPVYVLNESFSGQAIAQWLIGAASPDVYNNIALNITAALAAAGVTKIDAFLWWQGESDTANASYVANWATMIARFKTNSWFPEETQIIVHGIAPTSISTDAGSDKVNDYLQAVVGGDPDKRRFVYPGLLPAADWLDTLHMTGQGYFSAGSIAANAVRGMGRGTLKNIIVDPVTGYITLGYPAVSPDPVTLNANPTIFTPSSIGGVFNIIGPDVANALYTARSFGGVPGFIGLALGGNTATPTAVAANAFLNVLGGRGYDGTAVSLNQGQFGVVSNELWAVGSHGTYGTLFLTPNGSTTSAEYYRWNAGSFKVNGSTSGGITFAVPAVAGSNTITWPAGTTDFSSTGGAHKFVAQSSAGAALTVVQPAASDISGLAASATTDTTNAANISSGTLPAARLPNPSASTLGGVESIAAVSHNFLTSISTSGAPAQAQPLFTDIFGYAEASGSVTLSFGGGSTGITYTSQNISSTKIGNRVLFTILLILTSKGSSAGAASIAGLPINAAEDTPVFLQMNNGVAGDVTSMVGVIVSGTSTITPQRFAAGALTNLADTDFNNNTVIRISGQYRF